MDAEEVRDVVAAVPQRRRVHRQEPDAVDAEPLQVVELLRQPAQVARPVVVAVEEAAQVHLVEDGPLEPQRVALEPLPGLAHRGRSSGVVECIEDSYFPPPPPPRAAARRRRREELRAGFQGREPCALSLPAFRGFLTQLVRPVRRLACAAARSRDDRGRHIRPRHQGSPRAPASEPHAGGGDAAQHVSATGTAPAAAAPIAVSASVSASAVLEDTQEWVMPEDPPALLEHEPLFPTGRTALGRQPGVRLGRLSPPSQTLPEQNTGPAILERSNAGPVICCSRRAISRGISRVST